MTKLKAMFRTMRRKWAMTPEQAEHIAKIKFPCC